jgi:two-component system, chemotaxis family, protein-glutamate methylesterase/glutaminase
MIAKVLVAIGASSGGIEALRRIVRELPADFPAAVCVVVHTAADSPGVLDRILTREGGMPAINATTGMRIEPGRMYVAPPDSHLLAEPGHLRLTKGPKENRFRPAIDPLFRSVAQVYGPAAIGVILTGNLDDGTAGLWAIKRLGGVAVVQDPSDAMFPSMPAHASRHVQVDYSVPLTAIPPLLGQLVGMRPDERTTVPEEVEVEVNIAKEQNALHAGLGRITEPSPFACPECHGVLLRLKDAGPLRFRCHTGHGYSAHSLVAALNEGIENALWNAARALQEGGLLLGHLRSQLEPNANSSQSDHLKRHAQAATRQAEVIRGLLSDREALEPLER